MLDENFDCNVWLVKEIQIHVCMYDCLNFRQMQGN